MPSSSALRGFFAPRSRGGGEAKSSARSAMFIVSKPWGAHCDHKPSRRGAGLWKAIQLNTDETHAGTCFPRPRTTLRNTDSAPSEQKLALGLGNLCLSVLLSIKVCAACANLWCVHTSAICHWLFAIFGCGSAALCSSVVFLCIVTSSTLCPATVSAAGPRRPARSAGIRGSGARARCARCRYRAGTGYATPR